MDRTGDRIIVKYVVYRDRKFVIKSEYKKNCIRFLLQKATKLGFSGRLKKDTTTVFRILDWVVYFLVHLSRRLKCTIVIMRCPSSVRRPSVVRPSVRRR